MVFVLPGVTSYTGPFISIISGCAAFGFTISLSSSSAKAVTGNATVCNTMNNAKKMLVSFFVIFCILLSLG